MPAHSRNNASDSSFVIPPFNLSIFRTPLNASRSEFSDTSCSTPTLAFRSFPILVSFPISSQQLGFDLTSSIRTSMSHFPLITLRKVVVYGKNFLLSQGRRSEYYTLKGHKTVIFGFGLVSAGQVYNRSEKSAHGFHPQNIGILNTSQYIGSDGTVGPEYMVSIRKARIKELENVTDCPSITNIT